MPSDEWTGPFKRERMLAEMALVRGANEFNYRGVTFFVNDAYQGWIYVRNKHEYVSLDAVLDAIDKEVSK